MSVEIYDPLKYISAPQRDELTQREKLTKRWVNGSDQPLTDESLFDHKCEMFEISYQIQESYPALAQIIHFGIVNDMTDIHDEGEICAENDLSHSDKNYEVLKRKQKLREAIVVYQFLIPQIENEEHKAHAKNVYTRYIRRDSDDLEANMTAFIDKIQGTRTAIRENIYTPEDLAHVRKGIRLVLDPAANLINNLNGAAREEMIALMRSELDSFSQAGYEHQVNEVVSQFGLSETLLAERASATI